MVALALVSSYGTILYSCMLMTMKGYGICAHLLQHNCKALYLLGKKKDHLEEAEEGLKKYGDVTRVHLVQVELEDLEHTDKVAKKLASELTRLDALVLNAGLGVGKYAESKDGIESHMQVNVIAQHHIALTLLPILLKTEDSRLVLQSSEFHRMLTSNPSFSTIEELNTDIGPAHLYARSKQAQVLLMRHMYKLKSQPENGLGLRRGRPPWINATHPGAVQTDQQEQAMDAYGTLGKLGVAVVRPMMKEPIDEGCRSALFAATAESFGGDQVDGQYIVPDCKVTDVSDEAKDEELAKRLWNLVEGILSKKFDGAASNGSVSS